MFFTCNILIFSILSPIPPPTTSHNMDQNMLLSSSIISIFVTPVE